MAFTTRELALAYARAASKAYGKTMYVNERAGWPAYVTDYPTRHTQEEVNDGQA